LNIQALLKKIHMERNAELHQRRHAGRLVTICGAIGEKFPSVRSPEQIQMKHARWLIDVWFDSQGYATSTRMDYLRSLKLLIEVLGKEKHWLAPLGIAPKGPGGRPRKTKVSKQRRAPAPSRKTYKSKT
jgi:hypothetical protein